ETTMSEFGTPALDEDDIEALEDLDHVEMVDPMVFVSIEYLEINDGDQYSLPSAGFPSEQTMVEYAAGGPASTADDAFEMVIPTSWLSIFDIDDVENADDAVGETVTIGANDMDGNTETVEVEIAGVSEETITGSGNNPIPSHGLNQKIAKINNSTAGTTVPYSYMQAVLTVDNLAANETQLKQELSDIDMVG